MKQILFAQDKLSAVLRRIRQVIPHIEPYLYLVPMHVEPDPAKCPTAMTNGLACFFGAEFMAGLTAPQQMGMVLHEVMHLVRGDCSVTWVDPTVPYSAFKQLSNIAQDIVLEAQIADIARAVWDGPVSKNPIIQPNYPEEKYKLGVGKSWREVYAELKQDPAKFGVSDGGSTVDDHGQWVDQPMTPAQREQLAVRVARAVEASSKIKEAGDSTCGDAIDLAPAPTVAPWQTILRDVLTSIPAPTRRTWATVSRRAFAIDRSYKPGRVGSVKALDKLALFVDTSGSMSEILDTAGADIMALLASFTPSELDIVYYEGSISGQRKVKRNDIRSFVLNSMPGGGGTCVAHAMAEYVKQPGARGKPIVVLTDGYDNYQLPASLVSQLGRVIWVSYEAAIKPSYGVAVQVDFD
jgi:predicted metal-dependent peptidase